MSGGSWVLHKLHCTDDNHCDAGDNREDEDEDDEDDEVHRWWRWRRLVILYFGRRGTQSYVYSTMVSSFSCLLLGFIKPWKRKNGTIIYFNQSAQKISVGFLTRVRNSFQILLQRFVDMVLERRNSEQKKNNEGK